MRETKKKREKKQHVLLDLVVIIIIATIFRSPSVFKLGAGLPG